MPRRRRIRPPREREAAIERHFVSFARSTGAKTRKLNGAGQRDWPDQLVLKPGAKRPLLLEFKRPGGGLRPGQAYFFAQLARIGFRVRVADNLQDAVRVYSLHR